MRLACSLTALALAAAAPADVVERRGGAAPLVGEMGRVDDAGLEVRSEFGAVEFVPWDRVRAVIAEPVPPDVARRLGLAEELWRARSRVERRDTGLAEPLLERLFEPYRGQTNETALVVAEGLLRCRLARQAHVDAVIPALETIRLRRAGVESRSYGGLPPVIDSATDLCPALPPVWAGDAGLDRLVASLEGYDAGGDDLVARLADLYRLAALAASGHSVESPDDESDAGAGVRLVERLVAVLVASPEERDAARRDLRRRLDAKVASWQDAWVRFVLGRSLAMERDRAVRDEGLVVLAHLPARHARRQPYLSGLALAEMIRALEDDGDEEGAAALRAELLRGYPAHPVRRAVVHPRSAQGDHSS
jgi:hypothetical protein